MEVEIEVKARADPENVREKLAKLGARLLRIETQEDIYFEHPCRSMLEVDEALRLRVAEGRVELTYKGPRSHSLAKSRLEITVGLDDAQAAKLLLEQLGFREAVKVRKRRESYALGRATVALDEVEGLGFFVEVEGDSESEVLSILSELGAVEIVKETYAELAAKLLAQRRPS
ncbi:MAG: class IV adenylate cyclase [Thermofilaceae archaeon]